MSELTILALVMGLGLIGAATAWRLARWVLARATGTEKMQAVSSAIRTGAEAFLKRQYRTIMLIAVPCAALLFVTYGFIRTSRPGMDPVDSRLQFAAWITLSFLFGAAGSLIAGYLGMWISIRANIRTAAGVSAAGWQEGLQDRPSRRRGLGPAGGRHEPHGHRRCSTASSAPRCPASIRRGCRC